ncbi:MAG: hypothetical protein R3E08_11405 [Thiotrichaceae bacterium]
MAKLEFELHATEEVESGLEGTRIVREGSRYFLTSASKKSALMSENQRLGAVALDPGCAHFRYFILKFYMVKLVKVIFNDLFGCA